MARSFGGENLAGRIKESVDIADLIGSYLELIPRGGNFVALCPFHGEKTPSFSVNRQGQFFHCFGCKKSGDIFDFVMEMESLPFFDAMKMLGARCGIEVTRESGRQQGGPAGDKNRIFKVLEAAARHFEQNLRGPAGKSACNYLSKRLIQPDAIKDFRIGYATTGWTDLKDFLQREGFKEQDLLLAGLIKRSDKGRCFDLFRNRLILPIFDIQGRVLGFGGRVLDDSLPKYINSPETQVFIKSRLFYGLRAARAALTRLRCAVIVEGYTDVIMAHSRGVCQVMATLGTAMTDAHAKLLKRMVNRVIIFYDGDDAGQVAAGRGVEVLLRQDLDVTVLALESGLDPFDYFSRHDREAFETLVNEKGVDFFDFVLAHTARQYDSRTAGGKTGLARSLMKLVSCQQDIIKKDLLLKKIAQTVGVSEKLLRGEYLSEQNSKQAKRNTPPGSGQPLVQGLEQSNKVITTAEDDLIIGLLRAPELLDRFNETLQQLDTEDEEARIILEALCNARSATGFELKNVIPSLGDHENAKRRFITLASDKRTSDPKRLVTEAIEALNRKQRDREYERIRQRSRTVLGQGNKEETEAVLKEISERLKRQKGKLDASDNE